MIGRDLWEALAWGGWKGDRGRSAVMTCVKLGCGYGDRVDEMCGSWGELELSELSSVRGGSLTWGTGELAPCWSESTGCYCLTQHWHYSLGQISRSDNVFFFFKKILMYLFWLGAL